MNTEVEKTSKKKSLRIKYDTITKSGTQQSFTGVFSSEKKAKEWYDKYGNEWEQQGRVLVKVYTYVTEDE
jgi:hypothetical protein